MGLANSSLLHKERIRLANDVVGTGAEAEVETVAGLIHGGDSWLNSCVAHAIGSLGLKSLDRDLDAWQNDPDHFCQKHSVRRNCVWRRANSVCT